MKINTLYNRLVYASVYYFTYFYYYNHGRRYYHYCITGCSDEVSVVGKARASVSYGAGGGDGGGGERRTPVD